MPSKYFLKIFIVIIALVLRFWDISNNPAGIYVDEAAQGYNAYSLLKTGKDQYGQPFPIVTKLFGTYSTSLYTYYSILPTQIFGLNPFSTRFTSALVGTLLVLVTVFYCGNLAGLVVAITPVFVFFSRGAFEANLGLFLLVSSFVLYRQHQKYSATTFLALSTYAYHAEKLLLLIFAYVIFKKSKKLFLYLLLLILPLIYVNLYPAVNARATELLSSKSIVPNLFAYLSPDNLFNRPDPDLQRSFPELSVFYWWMIIPLIIGFINLKNKRNYILLIILFLLPGAITKDYFSTIRVLPAFFLLSLIISKGLKRFPILVSCLLCLVSLFEIYSNLILLKHERFEIWGYPYQQLFTQIQKYSGQKILIDSSRQKPLYILYAYFQQLNPQILQKLLYFPNYYRNTDFNPEFTYRNITIKPLNWKTDLTKYTIFIGDPLAISLNQATEHQLVLKEFIESLHIWAID